MRSCDDKTSGPTELAGSVVRGVEEASGVFVSPLRLKFWNVVGVARCGCSVENVLVGVLRRLAIGGTWDVKSSVK